jgi:CRP-like cAMP-binding protein
MTRDEIRAIPVFAELSDAGADRVSECASTLEVPAGQVLALQGDVGSGMFVVMEGTVTVELRGGPIELGPGEPVGELALLAPDHARIARVRAKTPVRCLGLAREDFLALVGGEPGLALALLRTLAIRLAGTQTA